MAIISKDEMLNSIKELIGESTDDKALTLIENVSDTFSDFDERLKDQTNWKQKYEENDSAWRTKYKERFFNRDAVDDEEEEEEEDKGREIKDFSDLFTTEKE